MKRKEAQEKKEWTAPKYIIHGDINTLTMYNNFRSAADNPQGPGVPATHGSS